MTSRQLTRFNSKGKLKDLPIPNDIYETNKQFGDNLSIYTGSTGEIQNSYKLEPDKNFPVKEIQLIAEGTLSESLKNKRYERDTFPELCSSLTKIIQDKVKNIGLNRYKLITVVHIGENRGQSARFASRCLWNEKHDNYASASFYGETIFAQATVYGVYFD